LGYDCLLELFIFALVDTARANFLFGMIGLEALVAAQFVVEAGR
jgi:hypothetical protein